MKEGFGRSNEPLIPVEAKINDTRRPVRLLGSHFSTALLLRRREDDNGFPEPDSPTEPLPPPVSTPDLAIQIQDVRANRPPCLSEQERNDLINAVREAVLPIFENADIRVTCSEDSEKIGIWTSPAVGDTVSAARNRGLERIDLLRDNEVVAFFVNASFIRRLAQQAWNSAPKRYNGNGQPDTDGPIHLTGFSVSFRSPNQVLTRVDGYDERPWPDVPFTLTITDTLWTSSSAVVCNSKNKIDADPSWLNYLVEGLKYVVKVAVLGIINTLILELFGSEGGEPDLSGIGCEAAQLLPQEIPIPEGQKLLFLYNRVNVTIGGIFAGGAYLPVNRDPAVTISGPSQIAVQAGTSVQRRYTALVEDFRGDLSFSWSAHGIVQSRSEKSTLIRFNTTGATPGQTLSKRVTVQVSDADGLVRQASITVELHIIREEIDDLPPVCRVKPWLPQCNPT